MRKFLILIVFLLTLLVACGEEEKISYEVIRTHSIGDGVEVRVDEHGIYHIYGRTDEDVAFAQGFVQAKTRLFFMEFLRRLGRGELSSLFGNVIPEVEELDRFIKEVQFDLKGRMIYEDLAENLSPRMKKLADMFCGGINLYIKGIREGRYPLPHEFKYYDIPPEGIEYWGAEDIAALGRIFEFFLSGMMNVPELDINIWEDNLPRNLIGDWIRFKPATPTTTIYGDFITTENFPYIPENFAVEKSRKLITNFREIITTLEKFILGSYKYGSNNWVISGSITKDGDTLLANDPHLPLLTPPIWEIFHLHSGNENALGFSVPGLPGLLIGVTDNIAWGETVAGYDVADFYFEKIVCNSGGCFAEKNGNLYEVKTAMIDYRVRTGAHKWEVTRMPIYYIPDREVLIVWDEKNISIPYPSPSTHYAIGFRWTGQNISDEFDAFLGYLKAENVDDFARAVTYFEVGAQNQVAIDRDGNILYFPHARIPVRSRGSRPWKVMNGFNGEGEWVGYLPEDKIPFLKNPERGFINTSNNDILGVLQDNSPARKDPYYYSSLDVGFRAKRVEDLILEGKNKNELTLDYMKRIQCDVKSLLAERVVKFILKAAENRSDLVDKWKLREAVEILKKWNYFLLSGVDHGSKKYTDDEKFQSVAASLFSIWWREFVNIVLGDEVAFYRVPFPDADFPARQVLIILHILEDPPETITSFDPVYGESVIFDDVRTSNVRETRDYDILKALKNAINDGGKLFGTSTYEEWNWGKIHQLLMINTFVPGSRGLFPTDGGEYTVNLASTVAGFLNQPVFIQVAGPSMRMIVSMNKKEVNVELSLPGANGEYRNGPDLFNYWWECRYVKIDFTGAGKTGKLIIKFLPVVH